MYRELLADRSADGRARGDGPKHRHPAGPPARRGLARPLREQHRGDLPGDRPVAHVSAPERREPERQRHAGAHALQQSAARRSRVQWIINPGRVVYDIIASQRRLEASGQQEQAVQLDSLRTATVQYYDLVLAQAQVAAARQAAAEAEEALRLTQLRIARRHRAGGRRDARPRLPRRPAAGSAAGGQRVLSGVARPDRQRCISMPSSRSSPAPHPDRADDTRARRSADRRSCSAMAVRYRPDLQSARTLLAGVQADKGSARLGRLGPQLQSAYTMGDLGTELHGRELPPARGRSAAPPPAASRSASRPSAKLKIADANVRSAALDVERQLDQVRVQVVAAQQASITNAGLIPIAREQVDSAQEALRLAESNLKRRHDAAARRAPGRGRSERRPAAVRERRGAIQPVAGQSAVGAGADEPADAPDAAQHPAARRRAAAIGASNAARRRETRIRISLTPRSYHSDNCNCARSTSSSFLFGLARKSPPGEGGRAVGQVGDVERELGAVAELAVLAEEPVHAAGDFVERVGRRRP